MNKRDIDNGIHAGCDVEEINLTSEVQARHSLKLTNAPSSWRNRIVRFLSLDAPETTPIPNAQSYIEEGGGEVFEEGPYMNDTLPVNSYEKTFRIITAHIFVNFHIRVGTQIFLIE